MVGAAPVAGSSAATTAWIVTTDVSGGGQSRRRVFLTGHGARTAAARELAAGRAATVTRATLLVEPDRRAPQSTRSRPVGRGGAVHRPVGADGQGDGADPHAAEPAPCPSVGSLRPQAAPEGRAADLDASWVDPDRTPSPWARPGDRQYVSDVMRIAWLRGTAFSLFDCEQSIPVGSFGSGGLGLIAAQLLDLGDLLQARLPTTGGGR